MFDDRLACLPSGFSKDATAFFSPGIFCPSGYRSACSDNLGVGSIETIVCCPTRGDITLSCVHTTSLKEEWKDMFCTWIAPGSPGTKLTVTSSRGDQTTFTTVDTVESPGGINAYGVRMVRQSTDVSDHSTVTSSPLSSSTTQSPSSSTTTSNITTTSSSLSTGAAVAIGVTIAVVVLAVVAGGFFLWWRRRHQQHTSPPSSNKYHHPTTTAGVAQPVELPTSVQQPIELEGGGLLAPNTPIYAELPTRTGRGE
ncbi:hypothetical protein B0T25DRAFT_31407 [Lasiosphaeria hispida]|uniref:Uncharacterized protein n=1 Tax=Lasiosphaeria hispida TaxID=260671 RepID=A0AAJ0HV60_9PEZI|nr:hypothetical protein B0T25DRAFT_31407 [Lasiosphaeria hispida]